MVNRLTLGHTSDDKLLVLPGDKNISFLNKIIELDHYLFCKHKPEGF